jgi:hypothetical protein
MADLLKQAKDLLIGNDPRKLIKRPLKKFTNRDLIKLESEIGRHLFGPIPKGHSREFFCLDAETWVWYEEWIDEKTGASKNHTIRYEVHPNGILKVQNGGAHYHFIEGEELQNLALATRAYKERVMRKLYKIDPQTGQPITAVPAIINPSGKT